MNSIFLSVVFIVNLINYTLSQSNCITPNGENGNCILFTKCEPFIKIWDNRTSKNIGFIKASHCGYLKDKPLVCCGSVAEYTNIVSVTTKQPITERNSVTKEAVTTQTSLTTSPSTSITPQLFTSILGTNTPSTILTGSSSSPSLFTSASVVPSTKTAIVTSSSTVSSTESSTISSTESSTISSRNPSISSSTISIVDSSPHQNHPNFDLLPSPGKCGLHAAGERISNGNETDLDEYPWMAMLLYKEENKIVPNCGGSLINNKYVMTAAHCIKGNLFSVRLGEYNINTEIDCITQEGDEVCADPPQELSIEDWIIFSRYSNRNINRHHDIALIRLKRAAIFSDFVKPICLPLNNERSEPGELLTVAGWGLTEKNFTSPIKLAVSLPLWSDISCSELYSRGYGINITSRQFCAGGTSEAKDSCGGDSGGPLMKTFPNRTEYYAEGIVSFGPDPCGRQATPGVYVRVTEYVGWILDNMKK